VAGVSCRIRYAARARVHGYQVRYVPTAPYRICQPPPGVCVCLCVCVCLYMTHYIHCVAGCCSVVYCVAGCYRVLQSAAEW